MKSTISLAALVFAVLQQASLFAQESVLNSGNWYHFTTNEKGVHKLSYEELSDAGILTSPVASNTLALFSNGPGMLPEENWIDRPFDLNEIHIAVIDNGDGSFDPGDYILFYGSDQVVWQYNAESGEFEHTTHLYDDYTHFFLTMGQGQGLRVEPGNIFHLPLSYETSVFTDYQLHETKSRCLHRSGKQWFGEDFNDQLTLEFSFSFPHLLFEPAKCHVDLASRSLGTGNFNNFVVDVAQTSFEFEVLNVTTNWLNDYVREANHTVDFIPNENTFEVGVTLDPVASSSQAWMSFIRVQVQRELNAEAPGQFHFRNIAVIGEFGSTGYTIQNYTSNHQVWEVTAFNQPNQMVGVFGDAGNFEFIQSHNILREYVCFAPDNLLTPEFKGQVTSQNLKGQPHAQGFIVTHPDFLSQAEQLAAFHEAYSNLSINVATTEQIFNEFSGGSKDITAIKDYLRYFYNTAESEDEKPQYLCLLGNASYDYKGYQHPGKDWVPTFQSARSLAPITSYCSDDYYGLLGNNASNKLNDVLELRIGRLPARSVTEAQIMVDKIIQYASNPEPGDWQYNTLFVADDEDNNIHMSQSNQLSTHMDENYCDLHIHHLYLDAFEEIYTENGPRYPDATEALLSRLDQGVLFCNYTGHSGHSNWAAEQVLVDTIIDQLQNGPRLPLFFMANCEFSRFDSPQQFSGSQRLMVNPNGGAIACISNSRLGYSSSNLVFNTHFNTNLFERENGEYQRLGDLIMETKNSSISVNVMTHRSINLMGDPMLRLSFPELTAEVTQVTGSSAFPDNVVAEQYQDLQIEGLIKDFGGAIQSGFNGTLNYLILDAEVPLFTMGNDGNTPYEYLAYVDTLAIGSAEVENGQFSFPAHISNNSNGLGGQGKLILFASGDEHQAIGCFTEFVSEPVSVSVGNYESLKVSFYPNPVQDVLRVEAHNQQGELEYSIFDGAGKVISTRTVGNTNTVEIDFSAFSAGVYVVRLQSHQQVAVARVVKGN